MTLAFGAAFPFAVAVATSPRQARRATMTASLANIGSSTRSIRIGAILGSLLVRFRPGARSRPARHHPPRRRDSARSWRSRFSSGAARLTRGRQSARLALRWPVRWRWPSSSLPQWDRALLSSGAYKYAPAMRGPSLETALTAGELLSYREGSTGTVAVRRLAGTISLAIDGKVDASNAGDMLTQRLLAHVPLLLHPESAARRDPRPRQRRDAGLGAHAIRSTEATCSRSRRRSSRRRGSSKPRTIARSPTRARA